MPMTHDEICMKLFHEQVLIKPTDATHPLVKLTEDNQQKKYEIIINNTPPNLIVVKSDKFPLASTPRFFNGERGECRLADYVLIDTTNKKIIYVELKEAAHANGKDIADQLKGAYCLIQYCKAIVKQYWDEPTFLKDYHEIFVCFNLAKSFNQQKKTKDESRGSSADNFLPINGKAKYLYKKLANLR